MIGIRLRHEKENKKSERRKRERGSAACGNEKMKSGNWDPSPIYKIRQIAFCFVLYFLHSTYAHALVINRLSGSDLGVGLGARAVALGGAFTALADDASAMFWNPAGLAQFDKNEVMLTWDMPDELSFVGIVLKPKDDGASRWKLRFGAARLNRLIYHGEGDWGSNKFAQHLIELSLLNVDPNFVGVLDSTTVDNRISIALKKDKIAIGFNFDDIRCRTIFSNEVTGRLCQLLIGYDTYDLGALIKFNDMYQMGLMYRNVQEPRLPKYFTVGFARRTKTVNFMVDAESIFGQYGEATMRKASFFTLRLGYEKKLNAKFTGRVGLIIPLKMWTTTLGNLIANLPPPKAGGSAGFSYAINKHSDFDAALFMDPGRSLFEKKLVLSLTASLRYRF